MSEKLQKVLARAGLGSRREIETWIAEGRLTVNNEVAAVGTRVEPIDVVRLDGQPLRLMPAEGIARKVLMYHKPEGEVTTRDDPEGRPTVFDRLPRLRGSRWIAVGRLDINTSGLLLFTNDGELANRLMHPSSEIEREYAVRIHGELKPAQRRKLSEGVMLDDGPAKFDSIVSKASGSGANNWYHVTIAEGRTREVRRMFEAVDLMVSRLIRVRYGNIALDPLLRQGMFRELTKEEADTLAESVHLDAALSRGERRQAVSDARSAAGSKAAASRTTASKTSASKTTATKASKANKSTKNTDAGHVAADRDMTMQDSSTPAKTGRGKTVRKTARAENAVDTVAETAQAEPVKRAPRRRTAKAVADAAPAEIAASELAADSFAETDAPAPKPRRTRSTKAKAESSHFADDEAAAPRQVEASFADHGSAEAGGNADGAADDNAETKFGPRLSVRGKRTAPPPEKKTKLVVTPTRTNRGNSELRDGDAPSLRAPRRGDALSDRMGMRDDRDLRRERSRRTANGNTARPARGAGARGVAGRGAEGRGSEGRGTERSRTEGRGAGARGAGAARPAGRPAPGAERSAPRRGGEVDGNRLDRFNRDEGQERVRTRFDAERAERAGQGAGRHAGQGTGRYAGDERRPRRDERGAAGARTEHGRGENRRPARAGAAGQRAAHAEGRAGRAPERGEGRADSRTGDRPPRRDDQRRPARGDSRYEGGARSGNRSESGRAPLTGRGEGNRGTGARGETRRGGEYGASGREGAPRSEGRRPPRAAAGGRAPARSGGEAPRGNRAPARGEGAGNARPRRPAGPRKPR